MSKRRKPPCLQVIVTVNGGVADILLKPKGVAVTLYDYDVEGCEETSLDKDPDGQSCMIHEWPIAEAAAANEHWPVVKHAIRDLARTNFRRWKCPDCGRIIEHSYEALADVGTPICDDCDRSMELL